jgi:hypothetical protein
MTLLIRCDGIVLIHLSILAHHRSLIRSLGRAYASIAVSLVRWKIREEGTPFDKRKGQRLVRLPKSSSCYALEMMWQVIKYCTRYSIHWKLGDILRGWAVA